MSVGSVVAVVGRKLVVVVVPLVVAGVELGSALELVFGSGAGTALGVVRPTGPPVRRESRISFSKNI
jgi:hypothetical protein